MVFASNKSRSLSCSCIFLYYCTQLLLATKNTTNRYQKVRGLSLDQKQPITPNILMRLHTHDQLDFTSSFDVSFWAVCLVAFYGMFRKSHLLPIAANQFNPSKQLTKADFKIFHWGLLITIRWSKTIQFRERVVEIPLPNILGSKFCPTAAVTHAFRLIASVSHRGSQAFNWVDSSQALYVLTYSSFVSKLRLHLSYLGLDPKLYASHSFRRGVGGGVLHSPTSQGFLLN